MTPQPTLPIPTLGQVMGPDPASIPALPPQPSYEPWLFEDPFMLVVLLAAVGIALALGLLRLGRRMPAVITIVLAALASGSVIAAAQLVTTPHERLKENTARLVQATAEADAAAMRDLLDPDVTLRSGSYRFIPGYSGRDRLIAGAEQVPRVLESVSVLEARAGLDGPRVARTQVRLRAYGMGGQLLGHSWWELLWHKQEDHWVVVEIEPLWIQR